MMMVFLTRAHLCMNALLGLSPMSHRCQGKEMQMVKYKCIITTVIWAFNAVPVDSYLVCWFHHDPDELSIHLLTCGGSQWAVLGTMKEAPFRLNTVLAAHNISTVLCVFTVCCLYWRHTVWRCVVCLPAVNCLKCSSSWLETFLVCSWKDALSLYHKACMDLDLADILRLLLNELRF